jgi:hypothetical protein
MNIDRRFTLLCLALATLVTFRGQAFAEYDKILVGTCSYKNLAHFPTIQQAVNSSPPGTTVFVCPGTYPEQVVINQQLILEGILISNQNAVVIKPPASGLVQNATDFDNEGNPIAAQILVQGPFAGTVLISNITVDGTGNGISGCALDLRGILFQNASGTLGHVTVQNEVPGDTLGVCQTGGEAIFVQTSTGSSTVAIGGTSVHNYNTNGVTGNDAGTKLTLTTNYIQGSGLVAGAPVQNGIQLGLGAKGTLTGNTVIDNSNPGSAGILLYDTAENSGTTVGGNTVVNSPSPIALKADGASSPNYGDGVTVTGNRIFGSAINDAIDVCTNGNTISKNTIFNTAESAIHLDASCGVNAGIAATGNGNSVTQNTITNSACAGILDDNSGGGDTNTNSPNTYYAVPFQVTGSTSSCFAVAREKGRAKAARTFHAVR